MNRFVCFCCFVTLAISMESDSQANLVFSSNFDGVQTTAGGVGAIWSGVTTLEPVQLYDGLGPAGNQFGGMFLVNSTGGLPSIGTSGLSTTLTLTNLPSHDAIDLDFLLGTINSWDGIDGFAGVTGDYFNVRVDGVEVFEATFSQTSGSQLTDYQAPPGGQIVGAANLYTVSAQVGDGAYDMGLEPALSNIPHTSSTATIEFIADGPGWQGERTLFGVSSFIEQDEAWAIDNLRVSVTAVPEPSSIVLIGLISVFMWTIRSRQKLVALAFRLGSGFQ